MQRNQQNDHTKSHVTTPTPAKQNTPTGGPNNVQNNRAHGHGHGHGSSSSYRSYGSGSGDSYHGHDPLNMVKFDSFAY